ncbi:MAG: type I-MYXAN CRISPR-associated endonuclease Cas1 [Deltaproteobacteria bacterium]|nr:type I-MYXAN CRISPR-associated endonuclease Cas1 [Deltaproteobacteria bacterium]
MSTALDDHEPTLRVSALHALEYCPRLFYLEEVETLYVQDARVFAGRALHEVLEDEDDAMGVKHTLELESEALGLRGKLDALRRRNGRWLVIEHKRGRAKRDSDKRPIAWESDRLQVFAYAMLLEESTGEVVEGCRVRYHEDNAVVPLVLGVAAREEVRAAIARARLLRQSTERPPVTPDANKCVRCSLAPVCLPEEERLAKDPEWSAIDLSVKDLERRSLHVLSHGARIGKRSEELEIVTRTFATGETTTTRVGISEVGSVVVHGGGQISTQALHLCIDREVSVTWVTGGGRFVATAAAAGPTVQRRVRQYRALSDDAICLRLAKQLVHCKVSAQLRFVLRATRGEAAGRDAALDEQITGIRAALRAIARCEDTGALLGHEGDAARRYFACWAWMTREATDERLRYSGRTRRPPKDCVSALLGFGYALLLGDVTGAIIGVGLEPALGIYHRPRSSAPPLSLDLMELFRVAMVDMPVIASINRGQWSADDDFEIAGERVWLSDAGRKKFVGVYERRKAEEWRHSVVGYSLSWGRMIELEARLLEKEWNGAEGLFARFSIR